MISIRLRAQISRFFLAACLLIAAPGSSTAEDVDLLPDEGAAVKMVAVILESYLGHADYKEIANRSSLKAVSDGDFWIVSFQSSLEGVRHRDSLGREIVYIGAGSGPIVKVSKKNACIVDITYLK